MKTRSLSLFCSLMAMLLLFCVALHAQVIESPNKIMLPVPPATNKVFQTYEVLKYRSVVEIEIAPGVEIPAGADLQFEIGPIATGPARMDLNRNWILSQQYDASGNVIGASKVFYDNNGQVQQKQEKNLAAGRILASQVVCDGLGRPVLNTLSAPITPVEFTYADNFMNNGGRNYNYKNFDGAKLSNPDPVDNTVAGTLGWYYSENNTLEPYVGTTNVPFSRTDYYNDGTNEVKRVAGIGETFKTGSGHESSSFVLPVTNELDHYLQVRNKYFPAAEVGETPTADILAQSTTVNISRDANGQELLVVQDKAGKVLMTGRPGNDLVYTNTRKIYNPAITGPLQFYYFKLFKPTTVNINAGDWTLYDMSNNEQPVTFSGGGVLAAGYYKLIGGNTPVGNTISYAVGLTDINYNYYNQLGQLVAAIPPEGVKKLIGPGINNYPNRVDIPFITQNEYDLKGQLKASVNKETGRSEFVYRTDGKLRFSQNAIQRPTGIYSYTNYDNVGRGVEAGEFTPGSGGIAFNVAGMTNADNVAADGGLGNGTRSNWLKTTYDVAVATGVTGYTQDDVYLPSAISYTESSAGTKTWYNYDDQDRVTWMVQDIPGLGKKTIDYTYTFLGQPAKVIFQKNVAAETFIHYYEYDLGQRLSAAFTNTVDNVATRKLQAKYSYYLHGPLKRVELGGNVQGVDYTYTVQGQLKAINHASKDLDPGKDGISGGNAGFAKDAFGMNLEYFNGDYVRGGTGVSSIPLATTIADDQYTGNVKGMSWFSRKPQSVIAAMGAAIENPSMYGYKYDNKYQLNSGTWGAPNYVTPGFAASSAFKEYNLNYDGNGNIQSLARTNDAGTTTDNFTYTYPIGTNQLQKVVNGSTTYGSYNYNPLGQLSVETPGTGVARYIRYDINGKVIGVYADAAYTQPKVTFAYNERGIRVMKTDYVNNNTTYYVSGTNGTLMAVYTQAGTGVISQTEIPLYATGRIGIFRRGTGISEYELSNHLGNVQVTIDQNRNIKQYADYYPFGSIMRDGGSLDYRYGFQGKYSEKDKETGWNAFELRMYDARIGRWLGVDPKGQYNSPYTAMGNNPVTRVDADGGWDKEYEDADAYYKENPNGKLDGKDGHWLTSDRLSHSAVWNTANMTNLQALRFDDYKTITQRTAFYGWFAAKIDERGFENNWPGAAYIVANQMSTLEWGPAAWWVGDDVVKFGNEGNKAIFDDAMHKLRDLYNGPVMKGSVAEAWDAKTLYEEQFIVVNPIYQRQSQETLRIIGNMARGDYLYGIATSKELRFVGIITDPYDRFAHGMTKVAEYWLHHKYEPRYRFY